MTEEEQRKAKREYDRKAKREQRSRDKAKALASIVPRAKDYAVPEAQRSRLDKNLAQLMTRIKTELPEKLSAQDEYVIEAIVNVTFGLENNFTQVVHSPEGTLIAGLYPDAAASEAIEYVHRSPEILNSQTFSDLYRKFLADVSKWLKKNAEFVSPEFASDIRREIDGTYELPPEPIIETPVPEPEPQAPQPSIEQMGTKLSEQLAGDYSMYLNSGSNIPREAQQYLNHGKLNRNRI